ncbi:DUF2384 domain-containing protein [Vibrio crassostreae]|nr:DUF2384 domain-containing protein [Vibrio crassostreae]CAK2683078.1 DUF2384 domain-containing protein [Vibrio crassostreae]CAK2741150.1 DUF2384 domain-containing protein [Vibrio crassostreae]CAK2748929.1 DUF2384 domain-containing protein [Vibrio crassostreae]CAK2750991.1 DUF2384 domain-containing protein [Vibrio crassostreae]
MGTITLNNTGTSIPRKGLDTSLKILDKWGANSVQIALILNIASDANNPRNSGGISSEQAIRISHILNIHAALRILFTNEENVYGFMTMENSSAFFGGRTPLSLIESGDLEALEQVAMQLTSLSNGN